YRSDVAMSLNNLGNLNRRENRMTEARSNFEEALEICRDLARENSGVYQHTVAATLNNLGSLHSQQKRNEEARKAFEEALSIYRDLARKDPDRYLEPLAV